MFRRLLSIVRPTVPVCGHRITQPRDTRKAVATIRRAGHAYVEHVIAAKFGQVELVDGWKPGVVRKRA